MKKKLLYIAIGIAVVVVFFVGYHFIRFLIASERMKELSAQLELKIQEWEKKEYRHQPLFGTASPGNALDYYNQAKEKIEDVKITTDLGWALSKLEDDLSGEITDTVIAYLERNKEVFELIKKGANAEFCQSLINLRADVFKEGVWPKIGRLRRAAKHMVLYGRMLERANKINEALEAYISIVQCGNDFAKQESLVNALIGVAISRIGSNQIERILNTTELTEAQLKWLMNCEKIIIDTEPSSALVYAGEQIYMESVINHYAKAAGFIPAEFVLPDYRFNRTDFINSWIETTPFYEQLIRAVNSPYEQAKTELAKFESDYKELPDNLTQMLLPGIGRLHMQLYKNKAINRGIYILASMQLYKLKYGNYPVCRADLVSSIVSDIPLDPFNNARFCCREQPDGSFLLYSVGDNLKDDGGDEREDVVITAINK